MIESLDPGKSIEHNILLKVLGEGLSEDTPVFARLSINEGNNEEFFTNEESLLVFGVQPYERGKIPIIGLHAVEDEIEIPIELYTHHFDALCKTLKSLGFETITFKDLLNLEFRLTQEGLERTFEFVRGSGTGQSDYQSC